RALRFHRKARFGDGKDIASPNEINFDGSKDKVESYSEPGIYRRRPSPVNRLNSLNPLGLSAMSGNVAEWCMDNYDYQYYANSSARDPKGPLSGGYTVIRGGSWKDGPMVCRVVDRFRLNPEVQENYLGFRLARRQTRRTSN
ncbi:MAG: SUMF1/EgtB/PvdO family nonheme iron enzyme, partial [Bacteroidota bacterium]